MIEDGAQTFAYTAEQIDLSRKLGLIFMPHAMGQVNDYYKGQDSARFVHYTSAESALSIIKSKRFWMRNTNCMADVSEVQRGFSIIGKFFSEEPNQKAFTTALDACANNAASEALGRFAQAATDIRFSTYISAISEHDDTEDSYGRLSMWRAFGGNVVARVGIVLKLPLFSQGTVPLNLLFNPVSYLSEEAALGVLHQVIQNVIDNRDFLRGVDREVLIRSIFATLLSSAVCLKHKAFHEEREWRVIYNAKRGASKLMESSIEVIGGVPQIIHKIPLDATVSDSVADLELARLFDRLIIGPSPYPWPLYEAFVSALKEAGVENVDERVIVSDIPIRLM